MLGGCQHVFQTAWNEVILVLLPCSVLERSNFGVYCCASKQFLPRSLVSLNLCLDLCKVQHIQRSFLNSKPLWFVLNIHTRAHTHE